MEARETFELSITLGTQLFCTAEKRPTGRRKSLSGFCAGSLLSLVSGAYAAHCSSFSGCRAQPLGHTGFSSCDTHASFPHDMWGLPGTEITPRSPCIGRRIGSLWTRRGDLRHSNLLYHCHWFFPFLQISCHHPFQLIIQLIFFFLI